MKKPLSIRERTRLANTAVVMLRNYHHAVLDLANLKEHYPEFMEEYYTLPHNLPTLLKDSIKHLERAEANLTSRKLLIL